MVTYLTKVPLHLMGMPRLRMDTPDDRHRDVMSFFGQLGTNPRQNAGILFRWEHLPNQAPAVLIRSNVLPENLPAGAPASKVEPAAPPAVGSVVSFRIAVNAVRRKPDGSVTPVPVSPPVGESEDTEESPGYEELIKWLNERLAGSIEQVAIINHFREVLGADAHWRRLPGNKKVIQVDTIDAVGVVADPQRLQQQLAEGVGRARSYGCGLLTIRAL